MYYKLHDHCKIVDGKARGAIYDLHSGKVFSINRAAAKLLRDIQRFDGAKDYLPAQIQFFDSLTRKNLGGFYVEKPLQNVALSDNAALPSLDFVWLELTARCNNRCLHCYTGSDAGEDSGEVLSFDRWLRLIEEIKAAGCSALQLIGGEPLLYPRWRDLVVKARELNYEFIEIFTNATLVSDDTIAFFAANQVCVATTVYADRADIHDAITQNEGSFEKTMRAIEKMTSNRIPLRVASILMKQNEGEAEKIMKLMERLGVEVNPPDVVRPTGRGENVALLPEQYQRPEIKPPFFTSEPEFSAARAYHPCLAGKIAIAADGNVMPCIFARDISLGNARETSLARILQGAKLSECWLTTKDKVKKCKDCEYRYACGDCRPLAASHDGDWLAAPVECGYDPYGGTWK